jgi:hypothetical protein
LLPPGNAPHPEAASDCANTLTESYPCSQPLADQASLSADLTFAVRAQSQAATLLWPYDRDAWARAHLPPRRSNPYVM